MQQPQPERVCPYCGNRWTPIKPNPKKCPHCKRELYKTDIEVEREKEKSVITIDVKPVQGDEDRFILCNQCRKNPAPFKWIEDNKPTYYCKECLIGQVMRIKQPNQIEATQLRAASILEQH